MPLQDTDPTPSFGGFGLIRPTTGDFKPWDDYRVQIKTRHGESFNKSIVDHCYSYWQVHQLHFIQKYPDLYENVAILNLLSEEVKRSILRPSAPNTEYLTDFKGMRHSFDALSFWITVYQRERNRTFAKIDEANGVRRLDEVQVDNYRGRLTGLASMAVDRFDLTRQDLYAFLRQLIGLYEDYRKDERYRLSDEIEKDIFACEHVIGLYAGDTREKMADELSAHYPHWSVRTFRHLDLATKEHDYVAGIINRVLKPCISELQERYKTICSFSEAESNHLLDYCETEGLGLLLTALGGMVAVGNEEGRDKFRRVQRYINLKNVLTSYEYLLKSLGEKAHLGVEGKTLTKAIRIVMQKENWFSLFDVRANGGILHANNTEGFLNNLDTLLNDDRLKTSVEGYWAQMFLVTCLARNCTVHSYPSEDRYYGNLFGPMLDAVIVAMLYTWKLAESEDWV